MRPAGRSCPWHGRCKAGLERRRDGLVAQAPDEIKTMLINLHPARYVLESAHCAVVSRDDGAYLLGYFRAPRHEWTYMATFDQEASAQRAFEVFDRTATIYSPDGAAALHA